MTTENRLKYITIPDFLLYNPDLRFVEKGFLGLVYSFNQEGLGMSNEHLGRILRLSESNISRMIAQLEADGWIDVKNKKSRWRRIYFAAGSKVNDAIPCSKEGFTLPLATNYFAAGGKHKVNNIRKNNKKEDSSFSKTHAGTRPMQDIDPAPAHADQTGRTAAGYAGRERGGTKTPHPEQQSREALLAELTAAGAVFKGERMHCLKPENHKHGDQNPSAGIYESNGVWRWKCHACGAGGDIYDVRALRTGQPLAKVLKAATPAAIGLSMQTPTQPQQVQTFDRLESVYADLRDKHGGELEALHEYTDAAGQHVQYVIRWRDREGEKIIRPAVRSGDKIEIRSPKSRVLYNLPRLAAAGTVIVAEGEKCCDTLTRFGFTATTSAGGCKAAARTDWRPLRGKEIIIWPDHDDDGRYYKQSVWRLIAPLGCKIVVIDPAILDMQDKEDVADYVQNLERAGLSDLDIKQNLAEVFQKANANSLVIKLQQKIAENAGNKAAPCAALCS